MVRSVAVFVLLATPVFGQSVDMRRPKKLIATGWDHPTSERLRENLPAIEKRPFDGLVVDVIGDEAGKLRRLRGAFSAEPWKREWFQRCVDDLRAAKPGRALEMFVTIGANPGNVDWFDDEGWRQIAEHWRIAAWVARQGGAKGILFDPEPYTKPFAQFRYDSQPQRDRRSFDEYYAKARQRGREVLAAALAEYPDLTLFCYFMNSVCGSATGQADPRRALRTLGYGLYPAMIDGWLDQAPPTVTFVDGCESAYRFNSVEQFLEAGLLMRGSCQELVSPENRAKYRAQVQVSFGIYLDAYWNPKDSEWGRWYVDGLGGSRVERLGINVETALRVADEYVWIYGEKFRWWPTPNPRVKAESWPEALPGCDTLLALARDPVGYARTYLVEHKPANLLANGDFSAESVRLGDGREERYREGREPAGWRFWQETDSRGTCTWDRQAGAAGKDALRLAGVAGGCALQAIDVKPGARYAVRAVRLVEGRGEASIRVRWQKADGGWTAEVRDRLAYAPGPSNEWSELIAVAQVPEGAGKMVLLLGATGQQAPTDAISYDDVQIVELK